MRNGELSMVDIDGIMMDGDDEMNDYYAGIVSSPVSAVGSDHHSRDISISPSQNSSDSFALLFGIQDDRLSTPTLGFRSTKDFVEPHDERE